MVGIAFENDSACSQIDNLQPHKAAPHAGRAVEGALDLVRKVSPRQPAQQTEKGTKRSSQIHPSILASSQISSTRANTITVPTIGATITTPTPQMSAR